jgi:hypothetical protein
MTKSLQQAPSAAAQALVGAQSGVTSWLNIEQPTARTGEWVFNPETTLADENEKQSTERLKQHEQLRLR